ncbi:DUF397 domain-containing protein [Streptomyces hiroshimensis]|uniref:DUF397 domain-containing protein n=1 Tax=Streptomyces hiroshimensis TaxID=66424 RepID=A0ABQ2Y5T3_9ACTN|nr:DUF397 domain-containing protein [Streptomyces hiroshimensis]GGX62410.1 hypothetical protein GCM10010324_03940 [Streptomyces hiroshimensis]
MHAASTTELTWRKSSHSGNGTECVEVSDDLPGVVPVRDSKRKSGPIITFTGAAWTSFVDEIQSERIV